jgi:hypothetical protein
MNQEELARLTLEMLLGEYDLVLLNDTLFKANLTAADFIGINFNSETSCENENNTSNT